MIERFQRELGTLPGMDYWPFELCLVKKKKNLAAHDLHTIKAIIVLAWSGEGYLQLRNYWQLTVFRGEPLQKGRNVIVEKERGKRWRDPVLGQRLCSLYPFA